MIFNQYFGHFLLNRGYITKKQLLDALEQQKSKHVKLGVLAVNAGYMTPKDVREVYLKQTKTDKVFGEIAVQEGFITSAELDELVGLQQQNHLSIGQVLLDEEVLSLDQLSDALEEYKATHGLTPSQIEEVQKGNIDTLIQSMIEVGQPAHIVTEYMTLFSRNLIRFIDDHARVESFSGNTPLTVDRIVHQQIHGDIPLYTYIATDEKGYLELGSRFAGETIQSINKLAEAAVNEFLNLHNNIFLINQSKKAVTMKLEPSCTYTNTYLNLSPNMKVYSVFLSSSKIYVIISKHSAVA